MLRIPPFHILNGAIRKEDLISCNNYNGVLFADDVIGDADHMYCLTI